MSSAADRRDGRAPTMNDVAREAGVALKTVSRFVNGETNIDPARAARIAEAIESLGYRRNLTAASLRPGWTSKVIGLITSDLANPYYSALARAVESTAWSRGYLLTTVSSEEDGGRHDLALDRLIEQRVDALLIVPPRNPSRPWSGVRPPIPPVVFLDRPADLDTAPTVLTDNAGGSEAATRELAAHGAKRIAFVGDSLQIYTMAQRFAGYRSGLRAAGLDDDPALVAATAHSPEEALLAVRELLRTREVDAIFAANNRAATGALHAFRERNQRLPIIAFDDFEAATLVAPQVSVVSQDVNRMGQLAVQIAIDGHRDGRTVVLPPRLILRGSERP